MSDIEILGDSSGIFLYSRRLVILIDPMGNKPSPTLKPDIILISHAHSDHVRGLKSVYKPGIPVIMSEPTLRILLMNGYKIRTEDIFLLSPGDTIDFKNIQITAYNAGHIIGSLMFSIDFGRIKIGYTGDFNYEDTVISYKADVIDSDVLILDATYGHPTFSFPPRHILYRLIREKIKQAIDNGFIPSLHGYSLGKGQELTRLAANFISGLISVNSEIARYNKVYEDTSKVRLGDYIVGQIGDILVRDFKASKKQSMPFIRKFLFTGWTIMFKNRHYGFPLSSHSSFVKLIDYVLKTQPSIIFTLYKYKDFFASFLKNELGIPSRPVTDTPIGITTPSYSRKDHSKQSTIDLYFS